MPPPQKVDHTLLMEIGFLNPRVWTLDGVPYLPWRSFDTPAIFDPSIALEQNVAASVPNGSVVDIVFIMGPGNPSHVSRLIESGKGNGR